MRLIFKALKFSTGLHPVREYGACTLRTVRCYGCHVHLFPQRNTWEMFPGPEYIKIALFHLLRTLATD